MMVGYLTIMSIVIFAFSIAIIIYFLRKNNMSEVIFLIGMGSLVALGDLLLEHLGTRINLWHYNESLFFVLGNVPIELLIIFFSASVIIRYIYLNVKKLRIPFNKGAILGALLLLSFVYWLIGAYLKMDVNILPLAILIGLWGIVNISDKNKETVVLLATIVAFADGVLEILIIGSGSYGYIDGFNITIPMIYGLSVLGIFGVMEQLHLLNGLLDVPFIKKSLLFFGIYPKKYSNKLIKK